MRLTVDDNLTRAIVHDHTKPNTLSAPLYGPLNWLTAILANLCSFYMNIYVCGAYGPRMGVGK